MADVIGAIFAAGLLVTAFGIILFPALKRWIDG